jgi:hypothetical protein
MATVTIEVPDELSELVEQAGDRLPELLARGLKEPTLHSGVVSNWLLRNWAFAA